MGSCSSKQDTAEAQSYPSEQPDQGGNPQNKAGGVAHENDVSTILAFSGRTGRARLLYAYFRSRQDALLPEFVKTELVAASRYELMSRIYEFLYVCSERTLLYTMPTIKD